MKREEGDEGNAGLSWPRRIAGVGGGSALPLSVDWIDD